MKTTTFYEVTKRTAIEAVCYTLPEKTVGRAAALFALGGLFDANAERFVRRPFVQRFLPAAKAMGFVDEKCEDVNVDALLAGIDLCLGQGCEINLEPVMGSVLSNVIGKITIDRQEFELWASRLREANKETNKESINVGQTLA